MIPAAAVRAPAAALVFALVLLSGCGSGAPAPDTSPTPSPGPTAQTALLGGGQGAFERRLGELRGRPVVVNQWASWCRPCRVELPFFQRLARRYQGRVAFLGINSLDSRDNAAEFLRSFPTPFPHFFDPDGSVARLIGGGRAFPTTAFYTSDGRLNFTRLGSYATEAKLVADIERYAL